jgi:hypothetical protein
MPEEYGTGDLDRAEWASVVGEAKAKLKGSLYLEEEPFI